MKMREYKQNIFTKILKKETNTETIYSSDYFIGLYDIKPLAKTHILLISKNYYIDYRDFLEKSNKLEKEDFHNSIESIVKKFSLEHFKIVSNSGEKSGQEVFHFHVHILG